MLDAAVSKDNKGLYKLIQLTGNRDKTKRRQHLCTEQKLLERWYEYFKRLINVYNAAMQLPRKLDRDDLPINTDIPSREEIT